MIKKYLEFVTERKPKKLNESFWERKIHNITNIKIEDLEDYFLRLKEVLNCEIFKQERDAKHIIRIVCPKKELNNVLNEIESIKLRIEDRTILTITYQKKELRYTNRYLLKVQFVLKNKKPEKLKNYPYKNESTLNESTNLRKILSYEDVEDQFLRLKEILNCEFYFNYQRGNDKIYLQIGKKKIFGNKNVENIYGVVVPNWHRTTKEDIMKELNSIKNRMEVMYPVKMYISKFNPNIPKENKKEFGKMYATIFHILYGDKLSGIYQNFGNPRLDLIKISIISND